MIAILMTQVEMTSAQGPSVFRDFNTLAYAAIDDYGTTTQRCWSGAVNASPNCTR